MKNKTIFDMTRVLVKSVLQRCLEDDMEWTLQGFGMLRTYLPDGARLNVWDSRYRVPNVSMIHTHPWHFDSLIVNGALSNKRFSVKQFCGSTSPYSYHCGRIKPGIGGGMLEKMSDVRLLSSHNEYYVAGDIYHQDAREVHISLPNDGTVTLNMRERVGNDEAVVFWPYGTEWVDAIPRKATSEEVKDFCEAALTIWDA